MILRCYNLNHKSYAYYGGRGIRVCKRWRKGENDKTGFECFVIDMKLRPNPDQELDRRDVNDHYKPSNCRWVGQRIQVNNRSVSRKVIYNGKLTSLYIACEKAGIQKYDVNNQIYHRWISVQEAFDWVVENSKNMRRVVVSKKKGYVLGR
jgi:hypothetical protein